MTPAEPKTVAVLDACVLYPPSLRDLLMWLATVEAYVPRLTEDIHAEWKGVMLDKGYDGLHTVDPKDPGKNGPPHPYHLPYKARRGHPLTEDQKAFNAHLSTYRIVVEHSLAQMNQFQVLAQMFTPLSRPSEQGFRHDRERHSGLTRVVGGLVNRRIAQRPLKVYAAI